MNERAKITASHLSRQAIVYLRQSSAAQVEHNRESTDRQYALAAKARELGWPNDRIIVIDEDLPVPALLRDRASPASPPKSHSPTSASCSDSRSRAWRATTPTGTASSTSAASPTR
jgi:hypothetical protein